MTGIAGGEGPDGRGPVLSDAEAARRLVVLDRLGCALDRLGMRSRLARNHRLVLRYNVSPCAPSGQTDQV